MTALHFDSAGDGSAIVLLHPVGLDRTFWGPLPDRLAARHRVLSVDLAGHGRSPAPTPDRGIAAYADDVAALLDALGIPSAGVVGLSFGGMIGQEFALRHPDRISALVVGACGPRVPPAARDAVRNRGVLPEGDGMAAIVDATIERWFTPPFRDSEPAGRVRERLLTDDPLGWAAGWHAISGFDALDRLGTIAVPALVIAGEHDAGTPVAATRAIADAIPGARFALMEGAPHMLQIEQADAYADLVTGFFGGLPQERREQ